jgi:2-hydroxy-6-oxonona-2,4-dienedioate hydrolase
MSVWTDFLGATLEWIDVDGVPTRVASFGEGPPLVLLHGRGGHLESWRANLRPLGAHHRVIAFDLLGHGLTARHVGDYAIVDLTDHAIGTLDTLGLGASVAVGQSIGGWVAVQIALRRPDLVRSLVLIEPAGLQSEETRLADPKVAAAYVNGGRAFEDPTREAVRDRLTGLVSDPALIDDELVGVRQALYAPSEARSVHQLVRAADNADVLLTPETLGRLAVPVLVVHGALANTPLDIVERAATAARARLETVDAKQWPQFERPALVNALISDFAA